MKNKFIKIAATVVLTLCLSAIVKAQPFSGVIEFKKSTSIDTTDYVYYILGNNVRIDEIGTHSHKVEGSFLIDLDAKTMKGLNHDRKIYTDQPTPAAPAMKGTCTVTKGKTVKNLQGYKCSEYIVKNAEEGTTVTYYLADGRFQFFEKLLRQLNRKEKSSIYYLQIQDVKNMFPMLSVQTDATGKTTGKLEVTKITKQDVDPAKFEIPKGYNKFEK